jgi:bifunctional ADP-heptose synthase (sugar kinase/adenylyltransferase)
MDTRRKILSLDAAGRLPRGSVTAVTGCFDALRAVHARRLAALPRPLLAVVLPCADALLPQRARAEMVAALRVVDYVVIAEERVLDALIEGLAPRDLVRMEAGDAASVRQLIEHVHGRKNLQAPER